MKARRRAGPKPGRTSGGRLLLIVGLAAVAAAVAAAALHWAGGGRSGAPPTPAVTSPAGGKELGRPDAPVTIEVFSDFLCGYCATMALDIEPAVAAEFVEAGVARMVYRHFPVVAQFSEVLAAAGECAADQQRFWAFHRAVFERTARRAWRRESDLDEAVREAGLDPGALLACARSDGARRRVEADRSEGARRGVQGTPTVFVNGQRYVGAQPIEVMREAINAARPR